MAPIKEKHTAKIMATLIQHSMRWTPCCPHADQNTTEVARTTLKDGGAWRLQVNWLQGTPTAELQ